ncbi:putative aldouronate transport system permease protein [Paenibacillus taihuensis]|uniref:Putative aldouronate transport system permease protein n=1 Tax=Paenibacillus taihuensis TaxID=1156355 RepID=A0A3D9S3U0_9BACL|nr:ABC transporter permease subunit [Paenibacillus taihuensis]REE87455.1 putative aldouronate transport system permease protein [Paenibacillus taihuensis]
MTSKKWLLSYHLMLLPGILLLIIFSTVPLFGTVIAFQDFIPGIPILKQTWSGLDNFKFMIQLPDSRQVFINTITIASMKMVLGIIIPITFALLLNEIRARSYKRIVQTIVYLPHFMSWVILSGILIAMLSIDGIVNQITHLFHAEPVMFLASNTYFRQIIVWSDVLKEFGFSAIVYLAALAGINPSLYEAAEIDGATRFGKLRHVTIPGIMPTIVLLSTLSLGNILNAGFDQVFNLYNPLVYSSGDIIDTYVYRMGLVDQQYGLATSVGLLKSVIAIILISISNKLADKFAGYRIF